MPNGGFGCAYCRYYTNSWCTLRSAKIRNDHWTVCPNIDYRENATLTNGFSVPQPRPGEPIQIRDSIYAITSDEGAYIQVPWLEDGEIHVVNSIRTCVMCLLTQPKGKGILWRGEKYFFCSYAHYLTWRNQKIEEFGISENQTSPEDLTRFYHFRELKVVRENTTEDQRKRAMELAAEEEKSWSTNIAKGIGFLIVFKLCLWIYHGIFG